MIGDSAQAGCDNPVASLGTLPGMDSMHKPNSTPRLVRSLALIPLQQEFQQRDCVAVSEVVAWVHCHQHLEPPFSKNSPTNATKVRQSTSQRRISPVGIAATTVSLPEMGTDVLCDRIRTTRNSFWKGCPPSYIQIYTPSPRCVNLFRSLMSGVGRRSRATASPSGFAVAMRRDRTTGPQ